MYIGCWCRPDIMTALSIVARYQDRPGKRHWQWLRHIALYLKHTQYLCLRFSRTARRFLDLTGYVDADYANSDLDGAKSRTGYLFFCCGAPIVWRSTLQPVVAQSTCESEYIAMNAATREAEWLRIAANFLFNDGTSDRPLLIHEDNQGAKALAESAILSRRTRHIKVRYHYVRQALQEGIVTFDYVNTDDQVADCMTKVLGPQKFHSFQQLLVVQPTLAD